MTKEAGTTTTLERETEAVGDLAGKYLTFKLAHEEYGIPILAVVEIIKIIEVTSVPRTPEFVRGVINLRGRVIPVVDLRTKFGMEAIKDTEKTCIIVVNIGTGADAVQMSILIDTVSEVLEVKAKQIEPPPEFGAAHDTKFILGLAKVGDAVKILIDINRVLSSKETVALTATSEA